MHRGWIGAGWLAAFSIACERPAPPAPVVAPQPKIAKPERSTLTLRCQDAIDALDAPPESYASVLDVVAFAKEPLGAYPREKGKFAKSGLVVRRGAKFELEVAPGSALRIGWGNGEPMERLVVEGCPGEREWMAFAGGFYVDQPRCEKLTVRTAEREVTVPIGIGAPCE